MAQPSDEHEPAGTTSTTSHEQDVPSPSPRVHVDDKPLPTDSMVTVRLSDPAPELEQAKEHEETTPPALKIDTEVTTKRLSSTSADEPAVDNETPTTPFQDVEDPQDQEPAVPAEVSAEPAAVAAEDMNRGNETVGIVEDQRTLTINEIEIDTALRSRSNSSTTSISEGSGGVDWEELERNEEQEPRDEGSDESTAFLLARLEQENNALAINPKAAISKSPALTSKSRPPSIRQLKELVNGPIPASLRYSQLPAPPPMTELEFYTALVTDYPRTAQCLPTLLSKKVRGGIPPPLRGMVWQSMAGSRDRLLEEQYDRLAGESSPYEGMIGKDIGRSFPGVEMFKDSDGDGQRMLGRVLKSFSLYDHKIGYCQGLGFLVGPLLMHMGEKEAFCVLVRLMEHYDLRSCFLPDLSGLHLRIYQFQKLLSQHVPALAAHLDKLQIEPAYVSQWFLSFFAVTCPLPMLFRIFDVIFAEGASETIMRVSLSLMKRHEQRILAFDEFEDVMQLLLSRGLWDTYGCNADDLVNDFVELAGIVTRETLQALETSFRETQGSDSVTKTTALPDLQAAASRFLGRIWASSNSSTKSANLSPGLTTPSRPSSFLRRTPSKQSLTSTINSVEGSSESSVSTVLTEATSVSRESSADVASLKSSSDSATISVPAARKTAQSKDRDLHSQIEDLLTALSEMQRDQSMLSTELQREREEREDDRKAVRALIISLKRTTSDLLGEDDDDDDDDDERGTKEEPKEGPQDEATKENAVAASEEEPIEDLEELMHMVEDRMCSTSNVRTSTILESKHQLREELARSKEQYNLAQIHSISLNRTLTERDQECANLRDELKDARMRLRESSRLSMRPGRAVQDVRGSSQRSSSSPESSDTLTDLPSANGTETSARASMHIGGLRELRLGRPVLSRSPTTPTFSKRTSSLLSQPATAGETQPSASEEALLVELVNAKTAEAVAKQEAEEAKAKLEALRKLLGPGANVTAASSGTSPPPTANGSAATHKSSPSQPNIERSATLSAFTSYMSNGAAAREKPAESKPPAERPALTTSQSFWGGWGKRSVSAASTAS